MFESKVSLTFALCFNIVSVNSKDLEMCKTNPFEISISYSMLLIYFPLGSKTTIIERKSENIATYFFNCIGAALTMGEILEKISRLFNELLLALIARTCCFKCLYVNLYNVSSITRIITQEVILKQGRLQ